MRPSEVRSKCLKQIGDNRLEPSVKSVSFSISYSAGLLVTNPCNFPVS